MRRIEQNLQRVEKRAGQVHPERLNNIVIYDSKTDPNGEKAAANFHKKYSDHLVYTGVVFTFPDNGR